MEKSAFEIKKYICREEKINSHFTVDIYIYKKNNCNVEPEEKN